MGIWSERVLPHVVDKACAADEMVPLRQRACAGLHGRVLEVGFGSGLNVASYPPEVTEVVAVEPSDVAWDLSAARRRRSGVRIDRTGLDGESLAEPDGSCDSALVTFTLCTIPDVRRALAEIHRVLVPSGTLHFLEHGLAPGERVARWQGRLEPMQRRVFGGCHLTRSPPKLLAEAGFEVEDLAEDFLPGPRISRPWTYGYVGSAVAQRY